MRYVSIHLKVIIENIFRGTSMNNLCELNPVATFK